MITVTHSPFTPEPGLLTPRVSYNRNSGVPLNHHLQQQQQHLHYDDRIAMQAAGITGTYITYI